MGALDRGLAVDLGERGGVEGGMLDAAGRWLPPYPVSFSWRYESEAHPASAVNFQRIGFTDPSEAAAYVAQQEAVIPGARGLLTPFPTFGDNGGTSVARYLLAVWPMAHGLAVQPSFLAPGLVDAMTWAQAKAAIQTAGPTAFEQLSSTIRTYFLRELSSRHIEQMPDQAMRDALDRAYLLVRLDARQYARQHDPATEPAPEVL